ncbi:MAG TPA: ATP-binding protein [Candidatus Limnocylindrales bacterium]|nr:ATP-binding protein [Candidatus Limnocylindrales bacterium]
MKFVLGLRQKLIIGFGGLLVIMIIIGGQSVFLLSRLGQSIDVILRENYRSIIAAQQMKESIGGMDDGVQFSLLGQMDKGRELSLQSISRFEQALDVELHNITLPGEGEKVERLRNLYEKYMTEYPQVFDPHRSLTERQNIYFNLFLPLFEQIKNITDEILQMNQEAMVAASDRAKEIAAQAIQRMYGLLFTGATLAVVFVVFMGRSILSSVKTLTQSVREIEQGNLDLVVQVRSRDELGQLAEAFNAMASRLREFRRGVRARLLRTQRTMQQALDGLPDAVIVLSSEGQVEMVNRTATLLFKLKPGDQVTHYPASWLPALFAAAQEGPVVQQKGYESAIQIFDDGQERFFLPQVVQVLDEEKRPAGIVIVLVDITRLRKLDELKSDLLSTVSHELRTPLTSIQMAIHLLLEEKIGTLTSKQIELLVAAQEDSDRLRQIIENLLDLSRIESGRVRMDLQKMKPREIIYKAVDPIQAAFQDRGISLDIHIHPETPDVWADPTRIGLVLANLLSNALKYTPAGGRVQVEVHPEEKTVRFSVSDTGIGIPEHYLPRVFDKFFRVPGQGTTEGAGLGLAIAKEIIEAHGGKMECQSREGEGTAFSFTLRRADQQPP